MYEKGLASLVHIDSEREYNSKEEKINFEFRCHEAVNLFNPYGKWHLKKDPYKQKFWHSSNGKKMITISYAIIFHNFCYHDFT